MSVLHYNLNLLTMMALTLSVGILVDDSIVVLENIYRHLEMGKPPLQAAIDGRSEIGLAALTITLVDVVVYVPIAVMLERHAGRSSCGPFAAGHRRRDAGLAAGVVHAHAAAGQPLPEATATTRQLAAGALRPGLGPRLRLARAAATSAAARTRCRAAGW